MASAAAIIGSLHLLAFSGAAAVAPTDIFILAGQSNMAGRGGVAGGQWDGVVPPECKPSRAILRLGAGGAWEPAHEPLHAGIDVHKTCGVGPGMAFANAVRAAGRSGSGRIGLVPCAAGGTRIDEWGRGSKLYDRMVQRARAAMGGGRGGRIRAVLWYQGESDTVAAGDAESYGGKMERLIRDLREDLGDPYLLIVQVALASGEGKFVETVRKAQLGIKLRNVRTVDAKGLALGPDRLHLTTAAQVLLGSKLAAAFLARDLLTYKLTR